MVISSSDCLITSTTLERTKVIRMRISLNSLALLQGEVIILYIQKFSELGLSDYSFCSLNRVISIVYLFALTLQAADW